MERAGNKTLLQYDVGIICVHNIKSGRETKERKEIIGKSRKTWR